MAQQAGSAGSVQKLDDLDVGKIALRAATSVVKRRPVTVSLWALGLLLAAFANGFAVDGVTQESYSMALSHAEEVDRRELSKALRALHKKEDKYHNAKGWFWSCDDRCQKALDEVNMARAEVDRVQRKKEQIMRDARKEVGIWSVFGVRDVRNSFWAAWKSGKDFAARYTMMDALFMMMPGGREETMVSMLLKLLMQYIVNLTMGLVGALFFFVYDVYQLIVSYGERTLSGLAFFLLVLVAAMATVGTYLFAIYGTVAGGGIYLLKQAAKQAAVEGGQGGARRPRQVQYGTGRPAPGSYRPHSD